MKQEKFKFMKGERGPMKAFLEEYGVIIVAAIVITIIIVAATPIGAALMRDFLKQ